MNRKAKKKAKVSSLVCDNKTVAVNLLCTYIIPRLISKNINDENLLLLNFDKAFEIEIKLKKYIYVPIHMYIHK